MDTKFDFILNKNQRDTYLAFWKAAHANNEHFSASDYLLHSFINPAVADIAKKSKQAFAPSGSDGFHAKAYKDALISLRYQAKQSRISSRFNLAFSEEQNARIFLIADTILTSAH